MLNKIKSEISQAQLNWEGAVMTETEQWLVKMQDEFARKKREMERDWKREIKILEKKQQILWQKEKLRREKEMDLWLVEDMLMDNWPLVKE